MSNETYKLTYFNIRGVAEPLRFIFALNKVQYTDERITLDETWPDKKPTFPWGSLPVLEVHNSKTGTVFKLAQTAAIGRFLGETYGLSPSTVESRAKCDEYVDAVKDFLLEFATWYKAKDEAVKSEKLNEIKEKHYPFYFDKFEKILVQNGTGWLVGDKPTWADLFVAHDLNNYGNFLITDGQVFKQYPNVGRLVEKVFALDEIAEWIKNRPVTPF